MIDNWTPTMYLRFVNRQRRETIDMAVYGGVCSAKQVTISVLQQKFVNGAHSQWRDIVTEDE